MKKLMTTGLLICMLLIGAKMHPFPITCTKMVIQGTEVILIGDLHTYNQPEAIKKYGLQINESNIMLQKWIEWLSQDGEETLFLLECCPTVISCPSEQDQLKEGIDRGDTLSLLCKPVIKKEPIGCVTFKLADRRENSSKWCTVIFNSIILKIIKDLLEGKDPTTIRTELESQNLPLLRGERSSIVVDARKLNERLSASQIPFLEMLSHMENILHSIAPPVLTGQYLDALGSIVIDLEVYKRICAGDQMYLTALNDYINQINKAKTGLEAFLGSDYDRTLPWSDSFFASIRRLGSFQSYIVLNDCDGANLTDTIVDHIADAGFYMDITDAIRRGVRRVVLYAGASHTFNLKRELTNTYTNQKEMRVIYEAGFSSMPSTEVICRSLDGEEYIGLSSDDLRRVLYTTH